MGVSPAQGWVESRVSVAAGGRTVRIFETSRSGVVTIDNQSLCAFGDAEVFLTIRFSDGSSRYLSAPLGTEIDVPNVQTLDLSILFLTGPAGSGYRALVNGHCIYELL
jgi:hypothetical protein